MRTSTMNRKAISEPSLSLDRERGFVGGLSHRRSGRVTEIDWNRLLFGKKVLTNQELADVDVEAPRNSLESSPGTRTPRVSGVRHDDIPFSFEIPKSGMQTQITRSGEIYHSRSSGELMPKRKPASEVLPIKTLIAQDSFEAEYERRKRSAPSVVARLMGLETLPDKLAKGSGAKPPKPAKSTLGSKRESKPLSAKAENSSRPPSPLHDVDTIKDFSLPRGRAQADSDVCEDRMKIDVLPFRAHPQERQLQEFKREFMEKLAHKRYGVVPVGDYERDSDEKRSCSLREKLSEAKMALASGGDESRRLSSAQEKLMESKEFQDAIELLQSNKEFFKKFFPGRAKSLPRSNKSPPEPESTSSRRSFNLEDLCRDSARYDDASRESSRRSFHLGDFSRDSRKSSFLNDSSKEFSRRSFHLEDLSTESRKSVSHHRSPKELSRSRSSHFEDRSRDFSRLHNQNNDVPKEIRALEDYSYPRHGDAVQANTGARHQATSEHRKRRQKPLGPNPVAEELVLLKPSTKVVSSWPTPDYNGGRHGSPNNQDSKKGSFSPSRIVLLKPSPGEIALLTPLMASSYSPQSYVGEQNPRGGFEIRDVLRDPRERFSPPRAEEIRYRDPRVDPRAIARDIVREARTNSTRELSRERESGRKSPLRPGDVNLMRMSGNATKKVSLAKYGHAMGSIEEITPASVETVGSFDLASLCRRQASGEEKIRSWTSPSAPTPSPRLRSQEAAMIIERSSRKEGKLRRSSEKPKAGYNVEHFDQDQHEYEMKEIWNTASPLHERNLSRASRSRTKSKTPGMTGRADPFLETQISASDDWKGVDITMDTSLPKPEKLLKVTTMMYPDEHTTEGQDESEEESRSSSPESFSKPRPVQNAVALVGAKVRGAEPERMENPDHCFSKEKRAEVRQSFTKSKKVTTVDASANFGRSGSQEEVWPTEELPDVVQDVHMDINNGSILALEPHNLSVVIRPSFEHAIPMDHGDAKIGARSSEQEILGAVLQRSAPTLCEVAEKAQNDHPRKHQQLEVPVSTQGSRNSEAVWSLATPSFENGDGDGASETSVDKCGQPSPVSVLDSPFEAEIPSPVEFKELNSDLQDLRLRLRLLKLDDSRSRALLESLQEKEKLISESEVVRETDNSLEFIERTDSMSSTPICIDLESHASHFQAENIDVEELRCPEEKKEELLYTLNVLVASGFTSSRSKMANWHSPVCPLDPGLYERLEDYYVDIDLQIAVERGNITSQGSYDRRLLFDVLNETLLQILSPYLSCRPWIQPLAPLLRPIPSSRQLVSATWLEILTCFAPGRMEEYEALDRLMLRDISRGPPWLDSLEIREEIALDLEERIFETLIEETVSSLMLPTK